MFAAFSLKHLDNTGSWIPKLENRVKNPTYLLWRHKTELNQIVTSIFNENQIPNLRNSEILSLFNKAKILELHNSEI